MAVYALNTVKKTSAMDEHLRFTVVCSFSITQVKGDTVVLRDSGYYTRREKSRHSWMYRVFHQRIPNTEKKRVLEMVSSGESIDDSFRTCSQANHEIFHC